MNKPWLSTTQLSSDQAKHLIQTQFPDLLPVHLEFIGQGWDNVVYRVNDEYVFRFPRRQIGADLIDVEWKVLPNLIGRLPIPIPEPLFYGKPTPEFAWHFLGYRFLPGQSVCSARLNIEQRTNLAKPLAEFLKALHSVDQSQAISIGAGFDALGMLDVEKRWPIARQNFEKIKELGLFQHCDTLLTMLDKLKDVRDTGVKTLVHGDFSARHLLVDKRYKLNGTIDWGDVRIGNPAIDLMIVFSFLPQSAHLLFFDAYGPIDDQTHQLSLFRTLYYASLVLLYSHDINDNDLLDETLFGLHLMIEVDTIPCKT